MQNQEFKGKQLQWMANANNRMLQKFKLDSNFPIYLWSLTIFTSPIAYLISGLFCSNLDLINVFQAIPAFYTLGMFLSLPFLLIFIVVFMLLRKTKISKLITKLILSGIGVAGIFFTFYFIDGSIIEELFMYYSFTFVFWMIILKIKTITEIQIPGK